MDGDISSEETSFSSKPMRKRSHSRRDSQGHSAINLGGTKREIAYAFHLHRSSSSLCVTEKEPTVIIGNSSNYETNMPMFSDAQYCYSLLEAMPLPGPVWSTTAPSVLAEPPAASSTEASVDLEWGENQASSYTWWLGFLESLDGNTTTEKLNSPFVQNIVMENSKVHSHESAFVDAIDQSCCPDDWLMIPTMENDLEDIVLP